MIPPTSFLPPIKRIKQTPASTLQQCLNDLQALYNPPVWGSTRRKTQHPDPNLQKDTEPVHLDPFERSYSIQWLTALLSLSDTEEDHLCSSSSSSANPEDVVSEAAALLANISGTAGAGNVERQFAFSTLPAASSRTVSVHIRDAPLDNQDYGSVGAQTWGGACILSEMLIEDPSRFGLPSSLEDLARWSLTHGRSTLRILELGAGTGLVSLAIHQFLCTLGDVPSFENPPIDGTPTPRVEIVATDYYPSVLENLRHNVQRNLSKQTSPSWLSFHVAPMDWSTFGLKGTTEDVLNEPFDIVFGADIVYEAEHATWIHRCLQTLLRKPSNHLPSKGHAFHLVFPLRRTHSEESNMVDTIFGSLKDASRDPVSLGSISTEDIVCDAEVGSDDEVRYAYREISWV